MKAAPPGVHRRTVLPSSVAAHLNLVYAVLLGGAAFFVFPRHFETAARALLAWDFGAAILLLLTFVMMARCGPDHMRQRAALQDQGRWVIFAVIVAGAMFSIIALTFIQKHVKAAAPGEAALYVGITVATILLSWLLLHTVVALRYAHEYYGPADDEDDEDGLVGGLEFPSEKQPDYWDFMYFSFVIGMTCQVSDVQISDRLLRRLALVHGIVAFFFNTIVLALTINIIAGLL